MPGFAEKLPKTLKDAQEYAHRKCGKSVDAKVWIHRKRGKWYFDEYPSHRNIARGTASQVAKVIHAWADGFCSGKRHKPRKKAARKRKAPAGSLW